MKKSALLAAIAISAAIVTACTLDDKLAVCVNQEEDIEKYIADHYADSTVFVTDSGVSRITMVHGSGAVAQIGDSVNFSYQGYTYKKGPSTQFAEGLMKTKLGDGYLIKGLDEGMVGMSRGEEAYIVFSARNGFFDKAVAAISPMTPLIYYVTLEDIYR